MKQRLLNFFGFKQQKKKDYIFALIIAALTAAMISIPSPQGTHFKPSTITARADILSVDNSDIRRSGIVFQGTQIIEGIIKSGRYKGEKISGTNVLYGILQQDKLFHKGDKAFIAFEIKEQQVKSVYFYDYYRMDIIVLLFGLFVLLLFLFAGITGLKAILSFLFTGVMLWKVLLPGFLYGVSPIPLSIGVVCLLIFVIIFLVGGFNRKGVAAFTGSIMGLLLTCLLAIIFGKLFKIHGAVMPHSETLLHSGYPYLNLTAIFLSGIYISSSGAVMDIAMDIAASMHEITQKDKTIHITDALISGLTVGRAVIGTMTTTLLLAYSSSFTAMFMIFLSRGAPGANILNYHYIAAEILHTIVGSFGLISVAPFTAMISALLFTDNRISRKIFTKKGKS
jgi:uncharacterized membrane protein